MGGLPGLPLRSHLGRTRGGYDPNHQLEFDEIDVPVSDYIGSSHRPPKQGLAVHPELSAKAH
eukprot:scaffold144499_cov40-Tisochrysis_lutea.AAC.3